MKFRRVPRLSRGQFRMPRAGRGGIGLGRTRGGVRGGGYGRQRLRRRGRFGLLPILVVLIGGAIYWFTNQQEVPLTGRSQFITVSEQKAAQLGVTAYQQMLARADVVTGGETAATVRAIGERLVAVLDEDLDYTWEFSLIDDPQANAFALPGGKTAVYTGMLPVAENVDGLAAVMGHEIAHVIARHGAERMSQEQFARAGQMAAGVALGMSDMDPRQQQMAMAALGLGAKFGLLLPYSRAHESEADYLGLIYLARACFDPREAPKLWARMKQASGGQAPREFMSTHPAHDTRISNFEQWMPEALDVRARHCGG